MVISISYHHYHFYPGRNSAQIGVIQKEHLCCARKNHIYIYVYVPIPLQLCSAINNCEQVRRSLMINEKLRLDDLAVQYEREGRVRLFSNYTPVIKVFLHRQIERFFKSLSKY